MQFFSHEVDPEKRTSLNITPAKPLCLKENTQISFDLKFVPNRGNYFGYVIRIIFENDQNIDIIYNQRLRNFKFVIGESFSHSFSIDSSQLFGKWNHYSIQFDQNLQEVLLLLDNKLICKSKITFNNKTCCSIMFGANNLGKFMTIDIPPMQVKDVSIKEGNDEKQFYPLSENNGTQANDNINNRIAQVKNPVWITPLHQNWRLVNTVVITGQPSVAFDQKKEILYIVAADSLYKLSFKTNQLTGNRLSKSMMNLGAGNQSIFNNFANKLYNFYIDKQIVSGYDAAGNFWLEKPYEYTLTEFWHANKFISSIDSALYIVGGYGQLRYKNSVQRYSFSDQKWETINPKGDFFMPRYLAALGANAASDTAYIIGGYGSKSGDQTINPKNNYELIAFSVRDKSFKHIYNFKPPKNEFCFSNSLIIDSATNHFYGLVYPIDRFNSNLQLIKGSLSSPEYELMGDSIPYSFHDIESFSDLFYCPSSQKLVAVTILSLKNKQSTIKIYTIDFPPNNLIENQPDAIHRKKFNWLFALLAIIFLPLTLYFFIRKRKKNTLYSVASTHQKVNKNEVTTKYIQNTEPVSTPGLYEKEAVTSSVFLFGHFEVIDKDGNDITRLFSPLLKEMFLMILLYTLKDGKGIYSEQLYQTLWVDKPTKDARNNFSVNIVKLKSILEKVGETTISKESGKWRLEILNKSIKLDYQHFLHLSQDKQTPINKTYISELVSIINKGAFLREVEYSWIDDFKSTVSGFVINTILSYTSKTSLQTEPDFILKLTNCIFYFDQMNEEALSLKCRCLILQGRHALAKDTYLNFCKEYKKNYGEDYEKSYNSIIEFQ